MLCAVIADDLTGACDSAVQFAAAGLRTAVALTVDVDADVVAWSTESRDIDPAESDCRLRRLAARVRARVLFKKIDSTFRGNTAAEIVTALDAFACDIAIVNPAFPDMGRIVQRGRLHVPDDPSFRPVNVAAAIRAAGGDGRIITFDAVEQFDLIAAAAAMLDDPRRVLWAGSAGFATALAGLLGSGDPFELPVERPGPALFCIGSDHPVTVEQVRRLESCRCDREHVVLSIARGRKVELPEFRPSALVLCGGDTASLVCRSIGAEWIDLRCEVERGIPAGILRGGRFDGVPVVTKSGGFGSPLDFIYIADYFDA